MLALDGMVIFIAVVRVGVAAVLAVGAVMTIFSIPVFAISVLAIAIAAIFAIATIAIVIAIFTLRHVDAVEDNTGIRHFLFICQTIE